jgi:hypothetical protein
MYHAVNVCNLVCCFVNSYNHQPTLTAFNVWIKVPKDDGISEYEGSFTAFRLHGRLAVVRQSTLVVSARLKVVGPPIPTTFMASRSRRLNMSRGAPGNLKGMFTLGVKRDPSEQSMSSEDRFT